MQFTTYIASAVLGFVALTSAAPAPAAAEANLAARQVDNFAAVRIWWRNQPAGTFPVDGEPDNTQRVPLGECQSLGQNRNARLARIEFFNLPSTYECRIYAKNNGQSCSGPAFVFRGTTGPYYYPEVPTTPLPTVPGGATETFIQCSRW
ncbi:hypothetical protein BJ508DRAFT_306476 [Ascobolus immersus RN42]|uniref:Uncharacterized protein n=1 Tax=Ascobolus immersus RN42 TaxID=1160509 RepID=A0A3N4I7H9_ASCIM|nr:hypothetical protein BJ508DRAFT_306476 [Ascobolus immersus RN42]